MLAMLAAARLHKTSWLSLGMVTNDQDVSERRNHAGTIDGDSPWKGSLWRKGADLRSM